VPAGPMAKTMSCARMASTYRFWPMLFGITWRLPERVKTGPAKTSLSCPRSGEPRPSTLIACSTSSRYTDLPPRMRLPSSSTSFTARAKASGEPVKCSSLPR